MRWLVAGSADVRFTLSVHCTFGVGVGDSGRSSSLTVGVPRHGRPAWRRRRPQTMGTTASSRPRRRAPMKHRVGLVLAGSQRPPAGLVEQRQAGHRQHDHDAATDVRLRNARSDLRTEDQPGTEPMISGITMPQSRPLIGDVRDRGRHHQRDGLHEVGADQLQRGQGRVEHQQGDHDDGAGPHGRDPDEEATEGSRPAIGRDRADDRRRRAPATAPRPPAQLDVEPKRVRGGREQQGEADATASGMCRARRSRRRVTAFGPGKARATPSAPSRRSATWPAVKLGEPSRPVHDRAAGLVDRRSRQVGRHDRRGVADSEEDQRRRHQSAAAHAR